MDVNCCWCGKNFEMSTGQYNYRVVKKGLNVYCCREHWVLSRSNFLSDKEKKKEKSEYDKKYRQKNIDKIKKRAKKYFKKDYAANPEKYRMWRKKRQKKHNEYCRKPEYRKWKKEYDQKHRAKKNYGEFAEASIALLQLAAIVDNRQAKRDQHIFNKSQKRKRNGKNVKRQELESSSMGLYQPS